MSVIDPRFDQRLRMIALRRELQARSMPVRYIARDGTVDEDRSYLLARALLRSLVFLVCFGVFLKIGVYLVAPSDAAYRVRVNELAAGNWAQRSLAVVLQADPATVATAGFLKGLFP